MSNLQTKCFAAIMRQKKIIKPLITCVTEEEIPTEATTNTDDVRMQYKL